MKTKISKDGNKTIVELSGYLDFEDTDPLKTHLNTILKNSQFQNVVVDMSNLQFVGSCGITNFILALRDFNEKVSNRPTYMGVKTEFRRLITAYDSAGTFLFGDNLELTTLADDEDDTTDTRPLSRRVNN